MKIKCLMVPVGEYMFVDMETSLTGRDCCNNCISQQETIYAKAFSSLSFHILPLLCLLRQRFPISFTASQLPVSFVTEVLGMWCAKPGEKMLHFVSGGAGMLFFSSSMVTACWSLTASVY